MEDQGNLLPPPPPANPKFGGGLCCRRGWWKKKPGEQTASFPPNPAFSPAAPLAEPAPGEWLLSPFPQSHTQPEPRGNEFIDTEGRESLKSNTNGQHSNEQGRRERHRRAPALPRGETPTRKAGKEFGKRRGCSATSPHVEATLSSLPRHSIAPSATTGASLIALLMIFTLHRRGLEQITSQHTWAGLKGWVAPALPHFFAPQPEHRGSYTGTPPSSGSCSSWALLESLPGHCDLFPALVSWLQSVPKL